MPEELTTTEAGQRYDLSVWYLLHLARNQRIKARRVGPIWLLDKNSLDDFTSKPRKPGPRKKQERQQEGASPTSTAHQQETVIDAEGAHIRIDPLQPVGQTWILAEARAGDMQATMQLHPYGTMASVWTLDKSYDRAESSAPGRMGRQQEQRGKELLALLEKHMRAALVAAGWHTEERAGNELWRYTGNEARNAG